MPRRNRRVALLALCLVGLTILSAAVSLGLADSILGVLAPNGGSPVVSPRYGILLVRVSLYLPYATYPIDNASVRPHNIAVPSVFSPQFQTNSSGELQLPMAPGVYSVSVFNDEFRTAVVLNVSASHTTEMDVNVSQNSFPVAFSDLGDSASSNFVSPWDRATLSLDATVVTQSFHPGDTIFLSGVYLPVFVSGNNASTLSIVPAVSQVSAVVLWSETRGGASPRVWLGVKLNSYFSLQSVSGLVLFTYTASNRVSMRVTTFGP